ncbi:MAG: hypothetical protein IID41_14680, partial [Planctomycetes bacterium]|nr:hypothetical protein [Planctomycetota bacterium]
MARKLGEAFVKITADIKGLAQGLAQAQGMTARAVGDIVAQLGLVEKALGRVRNIGLGLTLGVSLPTILASRHFLSLGSAAIELDNRFKITFGNMAKDVDTWSKQLAFSFGRGDTEIKQFVSTFNKMLVPVGLGRDATVAMSKELTQLVFDFASFEDQDPARVFRAFQSALVGMP